MYNLMNLLELVKGKAQQEHNEEVVGVPENLKVGAANKVEGWGYHQEESHCDYMACDASSCREANRDGVLCVCCSEVIK